MRILFSAEAVTLAHVARPLVLARAAADAGFEVIMACDDTYQAFIQSHDWQTTRLHSISSRQFKRALAWGRPVYDLRTLRGYAQQDLQIIDQFRPDVVVGDFRLSLSVSARLANIPYVTLTNAYWSPYTKMVSLPMPVLPFTPYVPLGLARRLFGWLAPFAMELHCRPMNRLRLEHGLTSLGDDLRRIYTDGDYVLYADVPEMFSVLGLPETHRYIGPIVWSTPGGLPNWWVDLPDDRPIIYVTVGSSGKPSVLHAVLSALADMPVTVVASTAGATVSASQIPTNAYVADYLPGSVVAAKASLVICNGGSPTSHQALAAGVPVLGIASNMDQFLNMASVSNMGAGILLRADRTNRKRIAKAAAAILASSEAKRSARDLAKIMSGYDSRRNFVALMRYLSSHEAAHPSPLST